MRLALPLVTLMVATAALQALAGEQTDDDPSAYRGKQSVRVELENGMLLGGREVATADGFTSGFRLMAGYLFSHLPHLELGAEIAYLESDEIPTSVDGGQAMLNTTSLNGALIAGVRLGSLGVFAKSGVAEWHGDFDSAPDQTRSRVRGTSPVYGVGASLRMNGVVGQLEYEYIDSPGLDHLNMATASLVYRF